MLLVAVARAIAESLEVREVWGRIADGRVLAPEGAIGQLVVSPDGRGLYRAGEPR